MEDKMSSSGSQVELTDFFGPKSKEKKPSEPEE